MVKIERHFSDGTRIYYEDNNGQDSRIIEYPYTPKENEIIKNNPMYKQALDRKVRKFNADKLYYLERLQVIAINLDEHQKRQLYNEIKSLHDRTGIDYDSRIINRDFFSTFGRYWPNNQIQCAAFFVTIYLAMLDLEEGKLQYPHSLGKTMVLKSCEAVILKNMDPRTAATMFQRKHKSSSSKEQEYEDNMELDYDSPYENYNGYNGFDDDTIDTAYDGYPKATWNTD